MSDIFSSVWSATPTPFDENWNIDEPAVERLVEHHLKLGVRGIFVAGTCGEGPWLSDSQRMQLLRTFVKFSAGRLPLAMQVSENSSARIVDNAKMAADAGADYAVIAPPRFLMNATPRAQGKLFRSAIKNCPLPVIYYDLGPRASVIVSSDLLQEIYSMPQVVAAKDSSADMDRRAVAIAARAARPAMRLLNGDEFHCDDYIAAGYDGLMTGGAAVTGKLATALLAAGKAGDFETASALQARMTELMFAMYGGPTISCWLAGLKYLLVRLGIFSTNLNILDYEVTNEQRADIDRAVDTFKEEL